MTYREFLYLVIVSLIASIVIVSIAQAHGPAEWIQRGGYKNAVGELCCGERDCSEIPKEDVKETPTGYRVTLHTAAGDIIENVPMSEAQPSPGGYWRCQWGGQRKCFFAEFGGS